MGHDHHFLSRLDRVSDEQVHLALELYRDPALVKVVLERARLPEDAERVAISLEDAREGPFIIVTRDAAFVTCLGKGMSRGELPVVTREQLDGSTAFMRTLIEGVDAAEAYRQRRGVTTLDLMKRLFEAGDTLTREEFRSVAAFAPLLGLSLVQTFGMQNMRAIEADTRLRESSARRADHALALERFKAFYGAAHAALLMTNVERGIFEDLFGDGKPVVPPPSSALFSRATVDVAIRAFWASARIGKLLLPHYKERFVKPDDFWSRIEGAIGLAGIAVRHASVRAEVHKTLSAQRGDNAVQQLGQVMAQMIEEREATRVQLLLAGAKIYVDMTAYLPLESPHRYATEEDVPEAVARTTLLTCALPSFEKSGGASRLLVELPLLFDEIQAEDFYWPENSPRIFFPALTKERAWASFEATGGARKSEPMRATRTGRNDPCPCGSGKKYKRCCG